MRQVAAGFALATALVVHPGQAVACQNPPTTQCDLVAEATVVQQGESFLVHFSITNMGLGAAPPVLDDLAFRITASALSAVRENPGSVECFGEPAGGGGHLVDPPFVDIVLDDSSSAAANGPTTWSGSFRVVPGDPAEGYWITIQACSEDRDGDGACDRQCTLSVCAVAEPDPVALGRPDALFLEPAQEVEGGGAVPFALLVRRNAYDPDRELTVRVQRYNFSDADDLFPIEPAEILGPGLSMTGDEQVFDLTCHAHYPCFAGVHNVLHASIWDGPTLLWTSEWGAGQGLGFVRVTRAPLARLEVVEAVPAGSGGALVACEPGQVHLRLYARNPWMGADFESVRLELELPSELEVIGHDMHFHDNPMDGVDPTPADLEAFGSVTIDPGRFRVDVTAIEPRRGSNQPIFHDLFEVELLLATGTNGWQAPGPIAFSGLTVTGTAAGRSRAETTDPVALPVEPGPPPGEVSGLDGARPLLVQADRMTLEWDDGTASGADRFNVYRGNLADLLERDYGACLASGLGEPSFADPQAPPPAGGWFYLVTGVACAAEGPVGFDSRGRSRDLPATCP